MVPPSWLGQIPGQKNRNQESNEMRLTYESAIWFQKEQELRDIEFSSSLRTVVPNAKINNKILKLDSCEVLKHSCPNVPRISRTEEYTTDHLNVGKLLQKEGPVLGYFCTQKKNWTRSKIIKWFWHKLQHSWMVKPAFSSLPGVFKGFLGELINLWSRL